MRGSWKFCFFGMGARLLGILPSSCTCRVLLSRMIYVVLLGRRKRDSKEKGNVIYVRFLAPPTNIPT